jgi:REP element-mobilizing transposase RayT
LILEQETTIRAWKTQKEYLKKYECKEHILWSDGFFVPSIDNVSKKQPKITYGIGG